MTTESTEISLCDIALAYAARGWSVIPLWPRGKTPLLSKAHPWSIYQKQRATPEEITEWWDRCPDANIGIVTGSISNLAVIDMDGSEGIANAEILKLPPTLMVRTGGGGLHAYYSFPETGVRNDQNAKLGEKIDIRGEGGYVVAPASIHETGNCYAFIGGFQKHRDRLSSFPKNVLDVLGTNGKETEWETVKCTEPWVTRLLQGVGSGERHQALIRLAGYYNAKGLPIDVTKSLLLDWNVKNNPPYEGEKVIAGIEDIYKRYPNPGAQDAKGSDPSVQPENRGVEIVTPKDAFAGFKKSLTDRKKYKGPELSTGFPSLDKVIGGLERGNVAVVGAWPGVGKTAWLLGVVKHLVESGHKVAYFPTEMSRDEVLRVFVSNALSIPFDRLRKAELDDDEMLRIERYITGEMLARLEICSVSTPTLEDVATTCRRIKPDVIILDYLQHTAGERGNNRENIQYFVYGLKDLARELNAASLVSSQFHRPYKNSDGQPIPPTMFDFAECGQIEREVTFALLMSPTPDRFEGELSYPVHFNVAKNRFGPVGELDLRFTQPYVRFTE